MITQTDKAYLEQARLEALDGLAEGGYPVGAVLVDGNQAIATGRNRSNQTGDMTAHAEIDCLRNAGAAVEREGLTLYTTMSPCEMCSGAVIRFGITRVVIGDAVSFAGDPDHLRRHGVEVEVVNDPDCMALMEG
ncbi:MAG: nucleoside deaminase [Paracoccaceae bacterium]|nr:nucleoside deaminase [Paracoccaceae bacterium]